MKKIFFIFNPILAKISTVLLFSLFRKFKNLYKLTKFSLRNKRKINKLQENILITLIKIEITLQNRSDLSKTTRFPRLSLGLYPNVLRGTKQNKLNLLKNNKNPLSLENLLTGEGRS